MVTVQLKNSIFALPCMLDNDLHAKIALEKSAKKMTRTPQRKPSPDALSWLNQTSHGASLVATANRLLQLQQSTQRVLPPPLNTACQILRWQDDSLTLGVPTAAHSAKLRQVLPRLVDALQADGWQVNQIKVRVQARRSDLPPRAAIQTHDIPPDGVKAFEELSALLPEGKLADAVRRLVRNRT